MTNLFVYFIQYLVSQISSLEEEVVQLKQKLKTSEMNREEL